MGDMADYYRENNFLAEDEDYEDESAPTWTTRDKRVLLMSEMEDSHLDNTIKFLRSRGARTPDEVTKDPLAAAEFQMSRYNEQLQKKLVQLLREKKRREKVPSANNAHAAAG